jgi:hypothetical protein
MHDNSELAAHLMFGWDPLWVSSILFVATYAVIVSEKVNRAVVSRLGAGLMITLGVLNQETAISGVDFNTLGLFSGAQDEPLPLPVRGDLCLQYRWHSHADR